jgi:hypothetical protein
MNRLEKVIDETWLEEPCLELRPPEHQPESGAWGFFETELTRDSATKDVVDMLLRALVGRTGDHDVVNQRLDDLEDRVAELDRMFREAFGTSEVKAGEFENWLETTASLEELRGKHVAFKSGKGLIAKADSLDELLAKVRGLKDSEISIGYVPVATL